MSGDSPCSELGRLRHEVFQLRLENAALKERLERACMLTERAVALNDECLAAGARALADKIRLEVALERALARARELEAAEVAGGTS